MNIIGSSKRVLNINNIFLQMFKNLINLVPETQEYHIEKIALHKYMWNINNLYNYYLLQ
jgi:hypothetical protein